MDRLFDDYANTLIPFDYDTFFSSEMEFEAVVTNCLSGQAEYMSRKTGQEKTDGDLPRLLQYAYGAADRGGNNQPYLDGGIADSVPVKRALEKGYRKIVVILTRNKGYRKNTSKRAMRCYQFVMRKYPNLARTMCLRAKIYNRTMEQIEKLEAEGKIFVIRPRTEAIKRLEHDQERLEAFYQDGYDTMKEMYSKLLAYMREKEHKGWECLTNFFQMKMRIPRIR